MTTTQLDQLKVWLDIPAIDTSQDEKLNLMLDRAESRIKERRRSPPDAPLESQYNDLQIQIAIFLYNKQGAEGEKSHDENGVNRSYENADIPDSLLKEVIPMAVMVS